MVAEGTRKVTGVKREYRKKLTASELRAAGVTPDLLTRRVRPSERDNRPQPTKDDESKHSRRAEGGG